MHLALIQSNNSCKRTPRTQQTTTTTPSLSCLKRHNYSKLSHLIECYQWLNHLHCLLLYQCVKRAVNSTIKHHDTHNATTIEHWFVLNARVASPATDETIDVMAVIVLAVSCDLLLISAHAQLSTTTGHVADRDGAAAASKATDSAPGLVTHCDQMQHHRTRATSTRDNNVKLNVIIQQVRDYGDCTQRPVIGTCCCALTSRHVILCIILTT